MRGLKLGFGLAAVLMSGAAAFANDMQAADSHVDSYARTDLGGAEVTLVNRGETVAIECSGIGAPGASVSVVMALDSVIGETPTGYQAVLATDQTIANNAVRVRVPNVPDLANHTVTVKVYVTGAHGTTACDAGHMRIV